MTILFQP